MLAAASELTAQDVRSAFSDLIDVERVEGLQGKFAAVSFECAEHFLDGAFSRHVFDLDEKRRFAVHEL